MPDTETFESRERKAAGRSVWTSMSLMEVMQKKEKLVIGLMSGTSADGVDAALVRISGCGGRTEIKQLGYISIPFDAAVRERILKLAEGNFGGSAELCRMNRLLGELYLDACLAVCRQAGVNANEVDLVGCHGQTLFHEPTPVCYLGKNITSTLQIGDPSVICEKLGAIAVSDFRVRDMAAGGGGAPLVPYTEYLLYRDGERDVALQNIGGIGNITFIPKDGTMEDVVAFDTGPGNVLIDAAVMRCSGGKLRYDKGGAVARANRVSDELLAWLMKDPYLAQKPPKSTGREHYNQKFVQTIYERAAALGVTDQEVVATVTRFTAKSIAEAVKKFLPRVPERLIVGGGGSYNCTLMEALSEYLGNTEVLTNEDIGYNSDAKEAVAFAVLANETVSGVCSNVPSATGAAHPVILGKISQ